MNNKLFTSAFRHYQKRLKYTKTTFKRLLNTTYKERRGEDRTYRDYLISSSPTLWKRYKSSRLQRVRLENLLAKPRGKSN